MSRTSSHVNSITGTDIRNVVVQMRQEAKVIIAYAQPYIPVSFDLPSAITDVGTMILNDIIESVHLQFYQYSTILCEYVYYVSPDKIDAYGPSEENPPIYYDFSRFPPGSSSRFIVTIRENADMDMVDEIFKNLGWTYADDLDDPDDIDEEVYGSFVSGGFGVQRCLRGSRVYRKY